MSNAFTESFAAAPKWIFETGMTLSTTALRRQYGALDRDDITRPALLQARAAIGRPCCTKERAGFCLADAQHLATELMIRYSIDRGALPAIALGVDASASTCDRQRSGFRAPISRQIAPLQ
jgi:hypothetical protein